MAAILTVAESSSAMVTVAVSAAPSIVICGSPAVTLSSVTMTVSLASTMASSSVLRSIVAVVLPAAIVTDPEERKNRRPRWPCR